MAKADKYRDLLIRLLPKGRVWQFFFGSSNFNTVDAFAQELSRTEDVIEQLVREQDPRKTFDLLTEWEKEYGLPDECTGLADSIIERRDALVSKILSTGGQSSQYFVDLFAARGVTITITTEDPSYVPMSIPSEVTGLAPYNIWYVQIPDASIDWFEADDSADDYIGFINSTDSVACLIEKYKPGHTRAIYSYGA